MLQKILELEGVQELSKNQQRSMNGGKKCRTISSDLSCFTSCRPSFLGIGLGSYGPYERTDGPCE